MSIGKGCLRGSVDEDHPLASVGTCVPIACNGKGDAAPDVILEWGARSTSSFRVARINARCLADRAACYRTHRAKAHARLGGDRREKRQFWRVREAIARRHRRCLSRRVTVRTSQRGSPNGDCRVDDDVHGDGYARTHNVCPVSGAKCFGGLCNVARHAVCCPGSGRTDFPAVRAGDGRGSLFAPSAWLVLNTPVQKQIDLKLYGFYIGELEYQSHRLTSRFGRQSF